MKLVFIGAGHFGLRCLELVCGLPEVRVTGVVTAPPVFSISYRPTGVTNVLHAGVAGDAEAQGVPVAILQQRMNESGLLESVQTWQPDAFLVVGWYHMIPKAWRALAPAYGLHASLLPDYSGGAPLVWAMINGETKTGITLFQMDDGVDSGPIADQSKEPIHPTDTIATLYPRIERSAGWSCCDTPCLPWRLERSHSDRKTRTSAASCPSAHPRMGASTGRRMRSLSIVSCVPRPCLAPARLARWTVSSSPSGQGDAKANRNRKHPGWCKKRAAALP